MTNFTTTSAKRLDVPMRSRVSTPSRVILALIGGYQRLTSGRPSPCRFYPSCSNYAHEAVEIHGAWRGTGLALARLSRCRPLGPHGVDLVPEPSTTRSTK